MLQNAVMDEYESLLEGTSTEKMRNLSSKVLWATSPSCRRSCTR